MSVNAASTQYFILGTAGHIDHGKTTLIKALTGIDTDRLPEEKARGLSIDLGFAHLILPSGRIAGIVDVPGHNKFLKNMLAGVGGFDLGILVIDAREGPKAQTKEHLEILELLALFQLVVVVNKIDLIPPDERTNAISSISGFMSKSRFSRAPLVQVSAITGEGVSELLKILDNELQTLTPKNPLAKPRLPIDRVFQVSGFGTVITGTLLSGTIKQNDRMMILPIKREVRIRNLETYGEKTDQAIAGSRVAANLTGVDQEAIKRGMVLVDTAGSDPSRMMEGKLFVLPSAPHGVKNGEQIKIYIGTAEYIAHIFLFDKKELLPGEEGFVHFKLESQGAAFRDDHFILRSFSSLYTIGGGTILEPYATRSRKSEKLETLKIREGKDLKNQILDLFQSSPWSIFTLEQILKHENQASGEEVNIVIQELQRENTISLYSSDTYIFYKSINSTANAVLKALNELAECHRFREGFSQEDLQTRLKQPPQYIEAAIKLLVANGKITQRNDKFAPLNYSGELPPNIAKLKDKTLAMLQENFAPPPLEFIGKELKIPAAMLKEIKTYLIEHGKIIFISEDIAYPKESLEGAKEKIVAFLKQNKSITPAQVRDVLGVSRKYIIPLLEYFDRIKVTIRKEDHRILKTQL